MSKLILVIVSVLILTACDVESYNKEITKVYTLPEGIKDCKVYYIQGDLTNNSLNVVRCPNSSTTTQWQAGKQQASATVAEL